MVKSRKGSQALRIITQRAKQMQRSGDNRKWTSLIKAAAAEYRGGSKGSPAKKSRKRRVSKKSRKSPKKSMRKSRKRRGRPSRSMKQKMADCSSMGKVYSKKSRRCRSRKSAGRKRSVKRTGKKSMRKTRKRGRKPAPISHKMAACKGKGQIYDRKTRRCRKSRARPRKSVSPFARHFYKPLPSPKRGPPPVPKRLNYPPPRPSNPFANIL